MTNTPFNPTDTAGDLLNGWAPLTHEALLRLQGQDACKFLQGQTTADFAKAQSLDVIPGAFCDVKGRVIADFRALVVSPDDIILCVNESLANSLLIHLTKYLMFSKADLTQTLEHPWGLTRTEAHAHFGFDSTPLSANRAIALAQGWLIPLADQTSLLVANDSAVIEANLNNESLENFTAAWRALGCLRGEARVTSTTTGKYLPQDLSYDLAGWVSFDKGCYTGQEIIARLHWRGTPKRRLYHGTALVKCSTEGAKLLSKTDNRAVGSIVNSADYQTGSLFLVEATESAAGQHVLIEETGQEISIGDAPIPYAKNS